MIKSKLIGAVVSVATVASALVAVPAAAQSRYDYSRSGYDYRYDRNRDGYDDRYDRDRNGYDDRYDRNRDGYDDRYDRNRQSWRYYGGNYGYNGYRGSWRTGQRYPYWRDNRYAIYDYGRYGLPAPRYGYRYYRDNNGDIVMAAIASGIIGLIISGGFDNNRGYDRYYRRGW